jgi:hypothetical protein
MAIAKNPKVFPVGLTPSPGFVKLIVVKNQTPRRALIPRIPTPQAAGPWRSSGRNGVLLVDTENRQVAEKTL